MVILAIECATQACSVAILDNGRLRAHRYEEMPRGHAERLLPMIQAALADAALAFAALDALAASTGPGTYTGVRIGLATARALALATGRPLIGVTTLEAVARAALQPGPAGGVDSAGTSTLTVALETKRADFYLQSFRPDLSPLTAPASVVADDVAAALPAGPLAIAGDAGPRLAGLLGPNRALTLVPGADYPDARFVAEAAAQRLAAANHPEAGRRPAPPPRALYLRPPDVTPPPPRAGHKGLPAP